VKYETPLKQQVGPAVKYVPKEMELHHSISIQISQTNVCITVYAGDVTPLS
jgi:hypothetical protein